MNHNDKLKMKQTYYYQVSYLLKGDDGIYRHLPIRGYTTTDRNKAEKEFDHALAQFDNPELQEVLEVVEHELDYRCVVKTAHCRTRVSFEYEGDYIIALNLYTFNPDGE